METGDGGVLADWIVKSTPLFDRVVNRGVLFYMCKYLKFSFLAYCKWRECSPLGYQHIIWSEIAVMCCMKFHCLVRLYEEMCQKARFVLQFVVT